MLETLHKLQGLHADILCCAGEWVMRVLLLSAPRQTALFTLEIWHHLKMRKVFLQYSLALWISVSLACPPLLWRSICILNLVFSSLTGSPSSGPLVQCQNGHDVESFRIPIPEFKAFA